MMNKPIYNPPKTTVVREYYDDYEIGYKDIVDFVNRNNGDINTFEIVISFNYEDNNIEFLVERPSNEVDIQRYEKQYKRELELYNKSKKRTKATAKMRERKEYKTYLKLKEKFDGKTPA